MCKNISYADVIEASNKIMSDMPIQLLREGKNIIGRLEEVSKEHCFMIRPDLKAFLIKGCQKTKKNEILRELTSQEYAKLEIESYAKALASHNEAVDTEV